MVHHCLIKCSQYTAAIVTCYGQNSSKTATMSGTGQIGTRRRQLLTVPQTNLVSILGQYASTVTSLKTTTAPALPPASYVDPNGVFSVAVQNDLPGGLTSVGGVANLMLPTKVQLLLNNGASSIILVMFS